MDGRARHVDIAKGISISLVVICHSKLRGFFPDLVDSMSLFRMPLFFLLSGVFFSSSATPSAFLLKKSEALLKPYFSVMLCLIAVNTALGGGHLSWQLKGMFYGNGDTIEWVPLWFLTHLFVVYLFSYALFKLFGLHSLSLPKLVVVGLVFIALGIWSLGSFFNVKIQFFSSIIVLPGLPFSLDIILVSAGYFILGSALKNYLINFSPNLIVAALSLLIFLLISCFTDAYIDLNRRVCDFPLLSTLGGFSGIYLVLSASYIVSTKKMLSTIPVAIGKASLFVLIFHWVLIGESFNLMSDGVDNEFHLFIFSILSFAVGLIFPLFIKLMVEKSNVLSLAFMPFSSNKLIRRLRRKYVY